MPDVVRGTLADDVALLERQLVEANAELANWTSVRSSWGAEERKPVASLIVRRMTLQERQQAAEAYEARQDRGRILAKIAALDLTIESLKDQIGRLLMDSGEVSLGT